MKLSTNRSSSDEFDMNLLNITFDYCRLALGVRTNFLTRVIFGAPSNETSSMPKCPIKIGPMYFENMLIDNSLIPSFPSFLVPTGRIKFYCQMLARGKVRGEKGKSLKKIYEYIIVGTATVITK